MPPPPTGEAEPIPLQHAGLLYSVNAECQCSRDTKCPRAERPKREPTPPSSQREFSTGAAREECPGWQQDEVESLGALWRALRGYAGQGRGDMGLGHELPREGKNIRRKCLTYLSGAGPGPVPRTSVPGAMGREGQTLSLTTYGKQSLCWTWPEGWQWSGHGTVSPHIALVVREAAEECHASGGESDGETC